MNKSSANRKNQPQSKILANNSHTNNPEYLAIVDVDIKAKIVMDVTTDRITSVTAIAMEATKQCIEEMKAAVRLESRSLTTVKSVRLEPGEGEIAVLELSPIPLAEA